jgi:hypothetical protein
LLLEEPGDLQHNRSDAGISLTELSDTLLLSRSRASVIPLSSQLLQAFGEHQLPAVAAYQETVPISYTGGQELADSALLERWDSLKGLGIFDAYLSWVQETLLLVINEVVSSGQPAPCQV